MTILKKGESLTQPQTFILESLDHENERSNMMEGKVLYDMLKLNQLNPIYYYFRTQRELQELIKIYKTSNYRYLHLSCHGNTEEVLYTFGSNSYSHFANIVEKQLNNRRVFISGCHLGNKQFAKEVFATNGGMYSITAPTKKAFFNQAASFWSAFYYMMLAWDSSFMKKKRLDSVLTQLSTLFQLPLAHFYRDMSKGNTLDEQFTEQLFDAKVQNLNLTGSFKGGLAGEIPEDR